MGCAHVAGASWNRRRLRLAPSAGDDEGEGVFKMWYLAASHPVPEGRAQRRFEDLMKAPNWVELHAEGAEVATLAGCL